MINAVSRNQIDLPDRRTSCTPAFWCCQNQTQIANFCFLSSGAAMPFITSTSTSKSSRATQLCWSLAVLILQPVDNEPEAIILSQWIERNGARNESHRPNYKTPFDVLFPLPHSTGSAHFGSVLSLFFSGSKVTEANCADGQALRMPAILPDPDTLSSCAQPPCIMPINPILWFFFFSFYVPLLWFIISVTPSWRGD